MKHTFRVSLMMTDHVSPCWACWRDSCLLPVGGSAGTRLYCSGRTSWAGSNWWIQKNTAQKSLSLQYGLNKRSQTKYDNLSAKIKDKVTYFLFFTENVQKWNIILINDTLSPFPNDNPIHTPTQGLSKRSSLINLLLRKSYPVSSMMQPSHGSGHLQSPWHTQNIAVFR